MAPTDLPDGQQLYDQAQSARTQATSGSDGWLPAERKYLPKEAWHGRSKVMEAYVRAGRYPKAYYQVNAPTIPKKPGGKEPLKQRTLAVFSKASFCKRPPRPGGEWP